MDKRIFKQKKELLTKISELKEIYIIGHAHPDADSIFASYLMRNIIEKMGIKCNFCILKQNYEYSIADKDLIIDNLIEEPIIVNNINNKIFLLVDHNDYNQSIGEDGLVIGAIDHHILTNKIELTIESEYASTCLLIYDLFCKDYNFSEYERKLIALSVISDTEYLKSSRFKEQDEVLYNSLSANLDVLNIQKKYFKTTDFTKAVNDNFFMDYKQYDMNDLLIQKVAFKTYHDDYIHFEEYLNFLSKQEGLWVLIWSEYDNNHSYVVVKKEKLEIYEYSYTITSAVLTLKDLFLNHRL